MALDLSCQWKAALSCQVQVCLVGSRTFATFGDQGTAQYVSMRQFDSLPDCQHYLKDERGTLDSQMYSNAADAAAGSGSEKITRVTASAWTNLQPTTTKE